MELINPSIGLIIWTTLTFVILLFLLKKLAWKPIMGAVNAREESIKSSLEAAEKAREEMKSLTAENERILKEAYAERDEMLKVAKTSADNLISKAKHTAKEEAEGIITKAREEINIQKQAAINELKNQVASLSIEIAEKLVRKDLANDDAQKALAETLVKEVNLN